MRDWEIDTFCYKLYLGLRISSYDEIRGVSI